MEKIELTGGHIEIMLYIEMENLELIGINLKLVFEN